MALGPRSQNLKRPRYTDRSKQITGRTNDPIYRAKAIM